jgi:hypothetical protein
MRLLIYLIKHYIISDFAHSSYILKHLKDNEKGKNSRRNREKDKWTRERMSKKETEKSTERDESKM